MAEVQRIENPPAGGSGTLGDVLYGGRSRPLPAEDDWARLVRQVAGGDEQALHALYDRAHRVVFTLAVRISGSRETAEEVTLDVFHDVWKRAGTYDPSNGTVLGWIMNQARSRAIDRARFDQRQKRAAPAQPEPAAEPVSPDLIGVRELNTTLRNAMGALTADERQALEEAYFGGSTYAEVAERLSQPLGTIKTRIRSALHKLRRALTPQEST